MVQIDRLNIRLPKGFEHRAGDIAHELATQLSGLATKKRQLIDRLVVPVIAIDKQATNSQIVHSMTRAIQSGIEGKK